MSHDLIAWSCELWGVSSCCISWEIKLTCFENGHMTGFAKFGSVNICLDLHYNGSYTYHKGPIRHPCNKALLKVLVVFIWRGQPLTMELGIKVNSTYYTTGIAKTCSVNISLTSTIVGHRPITWGNDITMLKVLVDFIQWERSESWSVWLWSYNMTLSSYMGDPIAW